MAYNDMTRCPQTEEEFEDYFFTLIGRTYGYSANDYVAVLSAAYPWQGQSLMIPPGVGPGIKADASWPFFGLTQQFSTEPKGRIFLPSTTPDENGYYTRCLQYLDDAAGTYAKSKTAVTTSTGLVWSWYWIAGHEYTPVMGPDSTTPPDSSELAARVTALEEVSAAMGEEMDDLVSRVTVIEHALANGLHAHGPINLPIVLESLTSLRCKGDIDVAVKPGQANPPDMSAADPPDLATIAILRRLLGDDEAES
jgi:hypothetical protein